MNGDTRGYDVIIVGGGNAAMCAALSAHEEGAKVLILERSPVPERGGNTAYTDGLMRFAYDGVDDIRALAPDLTAEEVAISDFGSYTESDFFDDMGRITQYRTDPDLCEIMVKNSKATLLWMKRNGVRFFPNYGRQAYKVDGRFKFWGGATIVVAPGTSRWSRVVAGVAHRLGGHADTHVTSLAAADGAVTVTRWYYRQRMEAVLTRTERPWVIAIDPGAAPAWSGAAGAPAVEAVKAALPEGGARTEVAGTRSPASDAQTIRPDAALLFVAGAGWTKKQADGQTHLPEAESLILGFLERSQASLGGSKSLVDQSGEGQAVLRFMTHLNQVGQTGATPRHPKGLATCCHGEEPHVVGWRFINERRAVNLDPNCGWARGKADVVYVADAFEVMRKVNQML